MAFNHSLAAKVKIDNNAGSLTDYTGYIDSFSFPRQQASAEVSVLSDTHQQFLSGLKGGTFSINGPYDPTFVAVLNTSFTNGSGTTKSFEVSPQGTTGGFDKYSFEAYVSNLTFDGDTGSAMKYSAEWQITGTITVGTN